jgi:hypothetical protein
MSNKATPYHMERLPPMRAATWKKLAEYSRSLASGPLDPQSRKYLCEIADRYEALAERANRDSWPT